MTPIPAKKTDLSALESAIIELLAPSVMSAKGALKHVLVRGLMGMASNTKVGEEARTEFRSLKMLFDRWFPAGGILSAGMSGDYTIAIAEGSNMVRIGSLLFGPRGEMP